MAEPNRVELIEDKIPLDGIRDTAVELVQMYGGEVTRESDRQIAFTLPSRRGVAAAGGIDCRMWWVADTAEAGTVTLNAAREIERPGPQHIAILVAGVVGATLWLLWPFFPGLGGAAWVGAVIAFAAYFLTLKRSSEGIVADLLQRLARMQRERGYTEGITE